MALSDRLRHLLGRRATADLEAALAAAGCLPDYVNYWNFRPAPWDQRITGPSDVTNTISPPVAGKWRLVEVRVQMYNEADGPNLLRVVIDPDCDGDICQLEVLNESLHGSAWVQSSQGFFFFCPPDTPYSVGLDIADGSTADLIHIREYPAL